MARPIVVTFSLDAPCADCGATWEVKVRAEVEARDAACEDVTVEERDDRSVDGVLRHRREVDCGCNRAPRDARGLMASRNHVAGVEDAYFDAAGAALRAARGRVVDARSAA